MQEHVAMKSWDDAAPSAQPVSPLTPPLPLFTPVAAPQGQNAEIAGAYLCPDSSLCYDLHLGGMEMLRRVHSDDVREDARYTVPYASAAARKLDEVARSLLGKEVFLDHRLLLNDAFNSHAFAIAAAREEQPFQVVAIYPLGDGRGTVFLDSLVADVRLYSRGGVPLRGLHLTRLLSEPPLSEGRARAHKLDF